jgi:hypothetical protein
MKRSNSKLLCGHGHWILIKNTGEPADQTAQAYICTAITALPMDID